MKGRQGLLVAVTLVVVALVAGAGPSTAVPPRLLVSTDGRAWSADLVRPLLDPDLVWVPGDAVSSSFLVRNQSGDPSRLWLQVRARGDAELLRAPGLELAVRAAGGRWVDAGDGSPHELPGLAPGATTRIETRATFDSASTNLSQQRTARFDLDLLLAGDPPPPGGQAGATGPLPHTGAELVPAGVTGLLLVALGLAIRPRRRTTPRRKELADA